MPKRTPAVTEPTPAPEPVAAAVSEPTATEQLRHDQAIADAADRAAALAYLESFKRAAEPNLAPRCALRDEAAPVLKRARAEDVGVLSACGCPGHVPRVFEAARAAVAADIQAVEYGERGLRDVGTLSAAECRRTAWHHTAGRWPGKVERIVLDLLAITPPLEHPRRNLDNLKAAHARIDGWVAGYRAQGGSLHPVMAQEPVRTEVLRSELGFNPMKTP